MSHRLFGCSEILLLMISGFMATPPFLSASSSPALPQPNVILITFSSLRADHTGLLGYDRDTTPHFDAFARRAVTFTNAFATSGWMMPAHASILTGLYPKDHHVTHIGQKLAESFTTLPEILRDQGYLCVGFCCNPRLSSEAGFAQGFDLYDDYSMTLHLENFALDSQVQFDINTSRTNDLVNDVAIGWIKRNTHRPFFLFVHYYDTHWDYLPPPPYATLFNPNYTGAITGHKIAREPLFSNPPADGDIEHLIALYDGEVRQSDQDFSEFLDALNEMDLISNSLIILTADHGEQFYEHGYTSHHGVFEELIHIPLIISVPNKKNSPQTIDALISQVDIVPTILDYLNLAPPQPLPGKSIKPLVESQSSTADDVVFAEYSGGAAPETAVIRSQRYKVYQITGQSPFAYDLTNDPAEQTKILFEAFTPPLLNLDRQLQKWLQP